MFMFTVVSIYIYMQKRKQLQNTSTERSELLAISQEHQPTQASSRGTQKHTMDPAKKAPGKELLDEDDDIVELDADDWGPAQQDPRNSTLWDKSWDDDSTGDYVGQQIRTVAHNQQQQQAPPAQQQQGKAS